MKLKIIFRRVISRRGYSADLIPWLTKHRHLGIDVVWVTQSLESVDITFRRNTGLCYALRRTENMGFKNMSFNYIYDRADNITAVRHLASQDVSSLTSGFLCVIVLINQRKSWKSESPITFS